MLGAFAGGPITSWIMDKDVWLAIYLGLGLLVICTVFAWSLPETLQKKVDAEDDEPTIPDGRHGVLGNLVQQVKSESVRFGTLIRTLAREERQVGILLLSLLFTTFGRDSAVVLMQYVAIKFKWSWSKVGNPMSHLDISIGS